MAQKKEAVRLLSPVGRLINNSLFEKDVYKDERGKEAAEPSYKVELAFDDTGEFKAFEDQIVAVATAEWGDGAADQYFEGVIRAPIQDGNDLAKKREAKGKKGDAYAGKLVLRASSIFNREGNNAAGGVNVCGPDAKALDFAERGRVYNGCYGKVSVTVQPYLIDGRKGIKLYLNGFQLVKDGDRIRGIDLSNMFSPMMGTASEDKGRKRRD